MPENPVLAFVTEYQKAVEPFTGLLDSPAALVAETLDGLLALAQQPVRLQKMLFGPSSMLYDEQSGLWSIGTLSAAQVDGQGIEPTRSGYAFTYMTQDAMLVSGTLRKNVLYCIWRMDERPVACCMATRTKYGWNSIVCMDEYADAVWIESGKLYYSRAFDYMDTLYAYLVDPLTLQPPALWEGRYMLVSEDMAVLVTPDIEGDLP